MTSMADASTHRAASHSAIRSSSLPRSASCRADVLLITPPLVQLNTPYPATAQLAGFLEGCGFAAAQADLSLELALRLLSADGLRQVEAILRAGGRRRTSATRHVLAHAAACRQVVGPVIAFLQGHDEPLAWRIVSGLFLPEGPRFAAAGMRAVDGDSPTARLFGPSDIQDRARHLASLFLDDLADAIHDGVDARFGFARYAEHLAVAAPRFDPLRAALANRPTLVDRMIDDLAAAAFAAAGCPALVALTVPFPGTLYGALRIARRIRQLAPRTRLALGGGYVNTELRDLDDPRIFDLVDAICFDDGEVPLLRLVEEARAGRRDDARLVRTLVRRRGRVVRCGFQAGRVQGSGFRVQEEGAFPNTEHRTLNTSRALPAFASLPLDRYLSLAESANPMHRLWSDGRWLKVQLAHGCYWHRCRFCDTALDYIGRYAAPRAEQAADQLIALHRRTGCSGFHFIDEALPPALLGRVADRLLASGACLTWWGNIRLERTLTAALTARLAAAGCVAVTGGLECASDRLLARMEKGVTLRDAARVCQAFADAGIRVHLYLMYGFPTQTAQETVDGLEYVRQLFEAGLIQSAYWHRFALTCHSPMAADPAAFGIRIRPRRATPGRIFAHNELAYDEPGAADHAALGVGLRRAVYNYMLGLGLDEPAHAWFDAPVPAPTLAADFVRRSLASPAAKEGAAGRPASAGPAAMRATSRLTRRCGTRYSVEQ